MLQTPIKLETLQRISLEWFLPLVYVVGLVYIAVLPEISSDYYVDENAFIVHSIQAASTINDIKPTLDLPGPDKISSDGIKQWLTSALGTPSIPIRSFEDDIVYATLRSRRSNGEDSIVIVIPYYSSPNHLISGLHVSAAVLKYLNNVKWLAKDIILVYISSSKPEALSRWVAAYHSDYSNWNESQNLPMERAGAIRAALVVDLPPSTSFDAISLICQTSQGVLPNFDLVAIVQHMLQQHNIALTLSDHYNSSLLRPSDEQFAFLAAWRPMLRFMADSFSPYHAYLHEPFIEFNIDALSLVATGVSRRSSTRGIAYISMVQALEETVRALSNLIEKLHHSSFVYILTTSNRLTTFLAYYWAAVIVALPWPLAFFHRLQNELPLSTMTPAFQAFSFVMFWSSSLRFLPAWFRAGAACNLGLWLLSSVLSLLFWHLYIPKQVSWSWFHSFIALTSLIVVLPYSVMNFTVTMVLIFATVPLVLVKPPVSKFDHFRNILLLFLSSPVIPLLIASNAFETSRTMLLFNFIEYVGTSNHHIYPLVFLLYLPNYAAAICATFFFRQTHTKTD